MNTTELMSILKQLSVADKVLILSLLKDLQ